MNANKTSRRPCRFVKIVYVLSIVFLIGGCGSSPDATYPRDQSMIKTFQENREAFTRLLSNPEDKAPHTRLGIQRVLSNGVNPKRISLEVWFHDFPGPGGVTKGFAYLERAPTSERLVDSIDRNTNPPISPEEKTLYAASRGTGISISIRSIENASIIRT